MERSAETVGAPRGGSPLRLSLLVLVGLSLLVLGGSLLVKGSSMLALHLGMSERMIGLTIVAVGTSLPELATSLVAARRGHVDMAVGNVVGSNIFNLLLCLGAAGLPGRIISTPTLANFDLAALGLLTVMALVMLRTERFIRRSEGALLILSYVIYLVATVRRG